MEEEREEVGYENQQNINDYYDSLPLPLNFQLELQLDLKF